MPVIHCRDDCMVPYCNIYFKTTVFFSLYEWNTNWQHHDRRVVKLPATPFHPLISTTSPNLLTSANFSRLFCFLTTLFSHFYFRATLGVKEVLQSSKFSTSIFWWFFILHHSHILKMCFRKNVCVCVCVCVSVCLSERRRTYSLNQLTDLVQNRYLGSSCKYFEAFFSFPPTLKWRVVHIRKK